MTAGRGHARFLASVTSESEASLAALLGADIIDCKDPLSGALGALPRAVVRSIRAGLPRHIPVSATIGDMPGEPVRVAGAVRAMAATGVDFVKVGVFPEGDVSGTVAKLGELRLEGPRLVGVLFADRQPSFGLIGLMRRAGFAGVMLDTAGKSGGTLLDHLPPGMLSAFIGVAREAGLFAGLAGALRLDQVPDLLRLGPDILGFRGALCRGARRESGIDASAILAVRRAIPRARTRHGAGRRETRDRIT